MIGKIKYKGFLGKTVKALSKISQSDFGKGMISVLSSSENNFYIKEGHNSFIPDDHGTEGDYNIT